MRVQVPGGIYHVMSRGDQRDDIFFDDVDRHDFMKTLAEVCQKADWQVHAFCLMRNHYHLVVETPSANLVAGMAMAAEHLHYPPEQPTRIHRPRAERALQGAVD